MLLLNEREVAGLLSMDDLIPLMRSTLADFSSGHAQQPVRAKIPIDRHGSTAYFMPGYVSGSDALAIKIVSLAPGNAQRGLPTHLGAMVLLDAATGAPLALLDARLVTEMRTAAVSAAAADALARREAKTLALIGSGVQAKSHLEALSLVRKLERVRVWSPNAAHREAFAREAVVHGRMPVEAVESAERAVREADVVVTVTLASEPVVRGAWLAEGACVITVGSSSATVRELDGEAVRRARVFVDSRAAASQEAGDLLIAMSEGVIGADHVRGEIGEVFAGRLPGRTSEREITLFKSLGQAVEDAATARLVYERARAAGVGREFELQG
jgi:ornithine cyclodeaminase